MEMWAAGVQSRAVPSGSGTGPEFGVRTLSLIWEAIGEMLKEREGERY